MKLLSVLIYTYACFIGSCDATIGLECVATESECLSSECCGVANYKSAEYQGSVYNPLITGRSKNICNTVGATSWFRTDSYGVTTFYDWSCDGTASAHILKVASIMITASTLAAAF